MRLDPFYWFLRVILRGFLKVNLKDFELDFVKENIKKHRKILWVNLFASLLVYVSLLKTPSDAIGNVITAMLAPVMVLGGAWFAISFGGVPKKLIDIAMSTTKWMFISFLISFSAMFISLGFVTPYWLWPVLFLIYIGTVIGCIQYDTADGLKAGLDDAVLKHSRAALLAFQRQGIEPPED